MNKTIINNAGHCVSITALGAAAALANNEDFSKTASRGKSPPEEEEDEDEDEEEEEEEE